MAAGESRVLVLLALMANSLIAVLKSIAAAVSGSAAMLVEASHSLADSGNQLFLLGARVEEVVAEMEGKIREFVPGATRIFVEVGPES